MLEGDTQLIQYIFVRTDLQDSLNTGKAVAQGCHAANLMETMAAESSKPSMDAVAAWKGDRGFGTTIVLGVSGENELFSTVEELQRHGYLAGTMHDPTYPFVAPQELQEVLIKGGATHCKDISGTMAAYTRPETTTGFALLSESAKERVAHLKLLP